MPLSARWGTATSAAAAEAGTRPTSSSSDVSCCGSTELLACLGGGRPALPGLEGGDVRPPRTQVIESAFLRRA